MVSVTSDIAASASFQGASPKSARTDQSPAPDSFSALVDSNASADTANDRANSASQDQPEPQRRDNDTPVASDNRPARRVISSADGRATADSDNGGTPAGPSTSVDAGIGTEILKPSKLLNSETVKTGILKLAAEVGVAEAADTPDAATSADQAIAAPAGELSAVVQTAIAVAIPVVSASVNVSAAPALSSNAQAPLAIAAAAIAASSSDIGATAPQGFAPGQTAPVSEAATPVNSTPVAAVATPVVEAAAAPTPVATPATPAADPGSPAKVDLQAAVSKAVAAPVNQPAAQTDTTVAADPKLAAAVTVAAPVVPAVAKVVVKPSSGARTVENATSVTTEAKISAAEQTASAASPQASDIGTEAQAPAIDSKPKAADGSVNSAKSDATDSIVTASPTATVSPHDRATATATTHAQAGSFDQSALTTNTTQQQQIQSAAPTAVLATQLTVTTATSAPVPLNGLALQIAVTAQSGKSRFEIRLDPAELGRIDVRIDVDRHGQVTSHLTVEKPETLAMLRQDAPHLQRALDDAGLKTGDSGLQFSLRDQSGQKDGNETGRNSQRLIISEEDVIPAAVAGRTYGRTLGSSGGVDIRV